MKLFLTKEMSFKTALKVGLLLFNLLLLLISIFAIFMLKEIDAKLTQVATNERPVLSQAVVLQQTLQNFDIYFRRYIIGEPDSFQMLPRTLNTAAKQTKKLELFLPPSEKLLADNFMRELKHLKSALTSYEKKVSHDPACSDPRELNELVAEKQQNANSILYTLVKNIRHRIHEANISVIHSTKRSRYMLFIYIIIVIIIGFVLSGSITKAMTKPINQLIEGAREIGGGDLDWKINYDSDDEFGMIAKSFNKMSARLAESQKVLIYKTKELEQNNDILQSTQAQLVQQEKLASIGQLAAGVSHELNNPLGGILGYAQFIMTKSKHSKGIENLSPQELKNIDTYIGYIEKEALRCKTIIANLLKFSRASTAEITPLDINEILEETIVLTQHQLDIYNIELNKKLAPALPKINGNEHWLQQVFANLIINAQQAMAEGGTLTIETCLSNSNINNELFVKIIFTDTGDGITKENLEKLFDPFFTTKPPGEGTGLGLSVSYGIIQDLGGELTAETKEGKGATFTVKLPVNNNSLIV